jgi:hypothetical protein
MDQDAYATLIDQVDRELHVAKEAALEKTRRQAKESALHMLRIQRQSLQAKLADFAKVGARPSQDLPALIDGLKEEERLLEKELALPGPAPDPAAPLPNPSVPNPPESPLEDLLQEIEGADFSRLAWDHAAALFRTWALRWRIECDRIGPRARDDRRIRLTFACIRTSGKSYPKPLPYLHALRQGSTGDWEAELEVALLELRRVAPRSPTGVSPKKAARCRTDLWKEELLAIAIDQKIIPADPRKAFVA